MAAGFAWVEGKSTKCWNEPGGISKRSLAFDFGISTFSAVIGFLRFVGVMNASVWFGASIFFTALVAPVFYTPEILQLVGGARAGLTGNLVLSRYYDLHLWCAGIALLHLVAECVYLGKPLSRFHLGLLAGLLCLALVGNYWFQPHLYKLQMTRYSQSIPANQRDAATRSYGSWKGVAQFTNFISLAGVMIYLWQVTGIGVSPRFGSKFRG